MGGPCHMSFWGCLCGGGIRTWWNVFFSFFDSPSSASKLSHWRLACPLSFFLSQFTIFNSCSIGSLDEKKDSNHCPGRHIHPFDSRPFPAGILKERPLAPPTGKPLARDVHHLSASANLVKSPSSTSGVRTTYTQNIDNTPRRVRDKQQPQCPPQHRRGRHPPPRAPPQAPPNNNNRAPSPSPRHPPPPPSANQASPASTQPYVPPPHPLSPQTHAR